LATQATNWAAKRHHILRSSSGWLTKTPSCTLPVGLNPTSRRKRTRRFGKECHVSDHQHQHLVAECATTWRPREDSLATSLQRLSSGLRVNSSKDDAAGRRADRNAQIPGINVAIRNASTALAGANG
jgi:hypothetical protein